MDPVQNNGIFHKATYKSGWTIVYIEGSQVIISKKIVFGEDGFGLNKHYAAFHLGLKALYCLPKYLFGGGGGGGSVFKGLRLYIDSSMVVHALNISPIEFMAAFVQ